METLAKYFEKIIIYALIIMMMIVILLSTIEFGYILIENLRQPPYIFLEIEQLLNVFSFFLLILIGVELLETIRAYLKEHVIHVEVVVEVALIAIARKVIILDIKDVSPEALLGIAAIVTALAVAFFLILYTTRNNAHKTPDKPAGEN